MAERLTRIVTPGVRLFLENRRLRLGQVESPTLDEADSLAGHGHWREAASQYHSLLQGESERLLKTRLLVELSQMLINLGYFGQAEVYLSQALPETNKLPSLSMRYYSARIWEKRGWIAGYKNEFDLSLKHLETSSNWLKTIPEMNWGEDEEGLASTLTHFSGRARLGLALHGRDTRANIREARGLFEKDLAYFKQKRETGDPRPINEGFDYLWLAKCYMAQPDLYTAAEELLQTRLNFEEAVEQGHVGVMASYNLVAGQYRVQSGDLKIAESEFDQAYEISVSTDNPRWASLALKGKAGVSWARRNLGGAIRYSAEAFRVSPTTFLYSTPFSP